MRIWSVHPRYLDRQALTACWREALLAQAVLAGQTRGYLNHPQLERFRAQPEPMSAIGRFLGGIADEADARGYSFDRSRIRQAAPPVAVIPVSTGQMTFEWQHLRAKLEGRSPDVARAWSGVPVPEPHPLFVVVDGPVEGWERAAR